MTTSFWSNQPSILFQTNDYMQVWPQNYMTFESKLNSVSRLVIILSFLGFLFTMNINFIFIGIITLGLIFFLYKMRKNNIIHNLLGSTEGFSNQINVVSNNKQNKNLPNTVTLDKVLQSEFYHSNKKNPLGNVLLTEISDNPNRKAAPPSFNPDVYEDITRNSKKMVQSLNPGIKNTNKQLFGDLADNFYFDMSMRNFYSMPNTRVTNDQGAYGDYLYGNMPSAKEGNAFALIQDNLRYILI